MGLLRQREPFDRPDWLFELKWDGFRSLFYKNEDGGFGLLSRNGNLFHGFHELSAAINRELKVSQVVLDGEIVCLDKDGKANFADLFYRRNACHFYAFDLLFLNGQDLRGLPLIERKRKLRRLLWRKRSILYVGHVTGAGTQLYNAACDNDLEGIACKPSASKYTSSEETTWVKIKNPNYSQSVGRNEMFDPHSEPQSSPWRGCHEAML